MVTRDDCTIQGRTLYHVNLRNADGSAVRCRINGKVKTWKKQPERWEVPVKHGLRDCFFIRNGTTNVASAPNMWLLDDPTELAKLVGLVDGTPIFMIRDKLIESGRPELAELLK